MEIREYNGIDFRLIDSNDLSEFIEQVYNNATFREYLLSRNTKQRCEGETNRLSDLLVKYYIATGDNRDSSISHIVESFANNPVDYKTMGSRNDVKFHQFRHGVFPFVIDFWKKELGKEELNFEELHEVLSIISTQSAINLFETHSFNGALKDKVDREGLDIHGEMFKNNYQILSRMSESPYQVGKLCFCNLSESSWGYMHRSPERLWMTIGSSSVSRDECENDNEFGKRLVDSMLESYAGKYDEAYLSEARNAAEEMVDFYTQTDEVCMAIYKVGGDRDVGTVFEKTKAQLENSIKFGFQLPYTMQRKFPRELVTKLNGVALKRKESMSEIEDIIEEMKVAVPDLAEYLDEFVVNVFSANMATYCVSHYMHEGMSDGFIVEGGRMPRESFALATMKDPVKEYEKRRIQTTTPKR